MVDGSTEVKDNGSTEVKDNELTGRKRKLIRSFVEDVLIHGDLKNMDVFINKNHYTEHNPHFSDNLDELCATLSKPTDGDYSLKYKKYHRLLAEGNFVLSVCEGHTKQKLSSFFDLYRLQDGKIVEHWNTTELIPPRSEWKNNNGKF